MLRVAATILALVCFAVGCNSHAETEGDQSAPSSESTLVGQLLLPSGAGSRGVEVIATVAASDHEERVVWLLFDEQGRFAHSFQGSLTSVKVTAGQGAEVFRADAEKLSLVNKAGQIDLGIFDLRDELMAHRLLLRAADGSPPGDVRVAMWFGLPPTGPYGEPVSLGSRQFPPVLLGGETEWLLSPAAHSIYFLVERPADSARGTKWRSGHQNLFGPFTSEQLPAELIMD